MAKFMQIVEYTTTRYDEVQAAGEKLRASENAAGTAPLSVTVTANRDVPNRYATIIVFDSYEAAMKNSNRPEVGEFAAAMAALCEGPPTFHNLDVAEEFGP